MEVAVLIIVDITRVMSHGIRDLLTYETCQVTFSTLCGIFSIFDPVPNSHVITSAVNNHNSNCSKTKAYISYALDTKGQHHEQRVKSTHYKNEGKLRVILPRCLLAFHLDK